MLIAKVYTKPARPEFWHIVRHDDQGLTLINFPLWLPYSRREAKWVCLADYHIDWVREFSEHQGESDAFQIERL